MSQTPPTTAPCPKCQHANPETVEFCIRCHARLRFACPACRHLQARGDKCEACGLDFTQHATKELARALAARPVRATPRGAVVASIAVAVVLVATVTVWLGVRSFTARRAPQVARPTAASSAPAADPDVQMTADSLRVLQGLRALTAGQVSYMQYGPRAHEGKATIDRYVGAPGGDPELKRAVGDTMDLYMLAAIAWNAALRVEQGDERAAVEGFVVVARHPALDLCAQLRAVRDGVRPEGDTPIEVAQGMVVAKSMSALFECAATRLAEAERRAALP